MLVIGFSAGIDFEQALRWSFERQPDFLLQFADRTRIVLFSATKMAGGRRIPRAGKRVLAHRTLLQKHFASRIKYQHMHRAMQEPATMHLSACFPADNPIAFIYHIKYFITHNRG